MANHKATPEQWAIMQAKSTDPIFVVASCVEELRARVERLEVGLKDEADCNKACTFNLVDRVKALEDKYETMRLATLEWGKDVDKLKRWSDQHLQRIMALEANAANDSDHTGEANKMVIGSLVDRVAGAIAAPVDDPHEAWYDEARAAIREVAAWLREQQDGDLVAATVLEQEALPDD